MTYLGMPFGLETLKATTVSSKKEKGSLELTHVEDEAEEGPEIDNELGRHQIV
jgi:hypothetical protein